MKGVLRRLGKCGGSGVKDQYSGSVKEVVGRVGAGTVLREWWEGSLQGKCGGCGEKGRYMESVE